MNASATSTRPASNSPGAVSDCNGAPWWRHGHVWLIISGPVAVVLAGIATAMIALAQPDPLVSQPTLIPAVKARNHAADPQAALRAEPASQSVVAARTPPGGEQPVRRDADSSRGATPD